MTEINILYLSEDKSFDFFKETKVSRVPCIGEKINIENDQHIAHIYEVVDVQFSNEPDKTDILVIDRGTYQDYLRNLESIDFR